MREVKKSFWDFVVVSGSSVLAIPLMIISESIQARYLGPANYGKVALVYSAISLLFLCAFNWLTVSIIRFGKEEYIKEGHLRKTTTTYFLTSLLSFLPMLYIFYVLKDQIFNFLEIEYPHAFLVIVIGVLIMVAKTFVLETLKAIRLIKVQTFLFRIVSKVFILAGMLLFLFNWLDISINYVIAILLLSDLVVAVIGLYFIKLRYIFPFILDKENLKTVVTFSIPMFFGAWSGYIVNYIDSYAIKYYMAMEDVGIYNAAYKVFSTLKSFISAGITAIMVPIIIAMKADNQHGKMEMFLKRVVPQGVFAGFIFTSLSITFAGFGFRLVYGGEYDDAVLPFQILAASLVITMLSSLQTGFYWALEMTKLLSVLGILIGIINALGDILLVKYLGILGPSLVSLFVFTLNPVILFFIIHKRMKVKRMLALFFCAAIFVVLGINVLPIHEWIRILLTLSFMSVVSLFTLRYNLFNKADVVYFDGISMPKGVKNIFQKIILLLSR